MEKTIRDLIEKSEKVTRLIPELETQISSLAVPLKSKRRALAIARAEADLCGTAKKEGDLIARERELETLESEFAENNEKLNGLRLLSAFVEDEITKSKEHFEQHRRETARKAVEQAFDEALPAILQYQKAVLRLMAVFKGVAPLEPASAYFNFVRSLSDIHEMGRIFGVRVPTGIAGIAATDYDQRPEYLTRLAEFSESGKVASQLQNIVDGFKRVFSRVA